MNSLPKEEGSTLITFEQLGLSEQALASLAEVGFTEPTEIQSKSIGIVAGRQDLIASAQTGSGKTVAYALPILDILRSEERVPDTKAKTKALVIVPTRELALQVKDEFERFGAKSGFRAVALFGGIGYRSQIQNLHRGADIIVATPGRLMDCVNRGYASLTKVQVVVLDEADRLLDMGFMPQVRAVIARVPKQRQTLMFSATIDARMKKIAEEFLVAPQVVAANQQKIEPSSIEQQFHYIRESEKEAKLLDLLLTVQEGASVLVFTKTRRKAGSLTGRLKDLEILAEEIHGDISQSQRVRTLNRFRAGEFNVLVATDVAARGLDVPAISHVINFDLPMQAEDYVHRIGRTGRAGRSGIAHSFVSNAERHLVREIHQILKNTGGDDSAPAKPFQRSSREAIEYAQNLSGGGRSSGQRQQRSSFWGSQSDGRRSNNQSDQRRRYGNSQDVRSMDVRSMDVRSMDVRSMDGRSQERRPVEGRSMDGRLQERRPMEGRSQEGRYMDGRSQNRRPVDARPQDNRSMDGRSKREGSREQTSFTKRLMEEVDSEVSSSRRNKPEHKSEAGRSDARSQYSKPGSASAHKAWKPKARTAHSKFGKSSKTGVKKRFN